MKGLKRALKKKAALALDHIVDATVPILGPRPSNQPSSFLYQQPVVNPHQPTTYSPPSVLAYPACLPAQQPTESTSLPLSQLPSPPPGTASTLLAQAHNDPPVASGLRYAEQMFSQDHDRCAVECMRAYPQSQDFVPDFILPPITPDDVRTARQLEIQQAALPGPKWQIGNVAADSKLKVQGSKGAMAASLSGLEVGVRFARENRKRYDEVGHLVLDTVRKGLSRVLDMSKGVSEIFTLREEVNAAALSYEGDDSIFGVTVADITDSTIPIFVVSYRHCVFEQSWRMSEGQIKELFVILSMLTDGGKLRLWCDRILPEKLARTLRWEAIGLLPYTMFPVIALGCHSTFVGEAADDRLWLEVERHMAFKALGLITIQKKVRGSRQARFTLRPFVSSSIRPQLIKVVGDGVSVAIALSHYAKNMLSGGYCTTTSSTYNLMEMMTSMAMRLLRGDSIQELMQNTDKNLVTDDFRGRQAVVYARLAESAPELLTLTLDEIWVVERALERGPPGSLEPFWDGIREFVPNADIGVALNVTRHRRSYTCITRDNRPEMIVQATLHGPTQLHGLLLVRRDGENVKNGKVLARICNVKLTGVYTSVSPAEWADWVVTQFGLYQYVKRLLETSESFDLMKARLGAPEEYLFDMPVHGSLGVTTVLYDEVAWQ